MLAVYCTLALNRYAGNDCRCADGWYNSSTGFVTCHDEGVSVDHIRDSPEFLFAAQETTVGLGPGIGEAVYGTQCSRCPGNCVTCADGIIRVKPGYALNARQAAEKSALHPFKSSQSIYSIFTGDCAPPSQGR
eukprot:COSAG02_NODE_2487_length_8704_cov_24.065311_2_plen_133_part_00